MASANAMAHRLDDREPRWSASRAAGIGLLRRVMPDDSAQAVDHQRYNGEHQRDSPKRVMLSRWQANF